MNLNLSNEDDKTRYWNKTERRLWIIALFFGTMMIYACRTVMPLCMPIIAKEQGWDKSHSGTVLSAFFWGYTLTQIVGGYMSDRIGGLSVLCSAAVGWSLLTFWTPPVAHFTSDLTFNFYVIILSRVLIGAAQGVHFPAMSSILAQKVHEDDRSFTLSSIGCGAHAGTLLCGSLGSLLLDRFGWPCAFYAIGTFAMGWLVIVRHYLVARERQKAMILSVKEITGSPVPAAKPVPWLWLFKQAPFWAIVVGHYCNNNAFFILLSWLPTYFHENYPSAKGWVFNVVPWLVSIPSCLLSGFLADKLIAAGYSITFVRKAITVMTLGGTALFLVLLSYMSSFEGALICMACAIACTGFHSAGILVNPQDIAPEHAGSVFGVMNTAGAVPGFVGVYITGHILEVNHSWPFVFNLTALLCIAGCIMYLVFGTGKKIL